MSDAGRLQAVIEKPRIYKDYNGVWACVRLHTYKKFMWEYSRIVFGHGATPRNAYDNCLRRH